jgi:alkylhydroperoxidase/carboxymuconolactone decarboxylase family protein YurZ
MKNLIKEAPNVAQSFFDLAKSAKQYSPLDEKTNELIIIGIFVTHRGLRGLNTHIERAMEEGATKEEVIAAILLALPIIGIADTNLALDHAMETIERMEAQMSPVKEVEVAAAH